MPANPVLPSSLTTAESMTRLSLLLGYPKAEVVTMLEEQFGKTTAEAERLIEDMGEPLLN